MGGQQRPGFIGGGNRIILIFRNDSHLERSVNANLFQLYRYEQLGGGGAWLRAEL